VVGHTPLYNKKIYRLAKVSLLCLLIFSYHYSKSQFYNLPSEYHFALLTEKQLAARDSHIHTGIKPYIPFFSTKYNHVSDTFKLFRFIHDDPGVNIVFYRHLINISPKKENFTLTLDPLLNLEGGRDSPDNSNNLYNNTRGFIGTGRIGNKFYFETMLAENQSLFPDYIRRNAIQTQVVPGQGRWKTFNITGFDYAFSSGFVSIQPFKNFNIQAGHGKQKIGHGYRSLLLSDNAFNYPYVRFTSQWFKGRVQYSNIYTVMMNLVQASKILPPSTERLFQKKPASFQYLSVNLTKRINIGLFQGLIHQPGDSVNRQHLSWQYFNPLIFTSIPSLGLNHKNNIICGADLKIKLSDKINIYGQLMADDLSNMDSVSNSTGFQAGFNIFDLFRIRGLFFQCEYNSALRASYNGPENVNTNQSYTHYNQNLAYTPGNGQELVIITDYRIKRFFVSVKYNYQTILTGHKTYSYHNILNARVGYLINTAYNLNVALGINHRNQIFSNFKPSNNETNYIYLGLRTSIYNLYYDF
jgi:hypothetical protein